MPFAEDEHGYYYQSDGDLKVGVDEDVFSLGNVIQKLFSLCWSIAHIANHLHISQDEVREKLKK
jgi:hypothetical protein